MTTLLKDITQAEYDRLANKYYAEVQDAPEDKYLAFFAQVQAKLVKAMRKKLKPLGYSFVRTESQPGPGVLYKITSHRDAFGGINVIDRYVKVTDLMRDIRQINMSLGKFPDVKIIVPEYLDEKVNELADEVVRKFTKMKKII